MTNRKGLLKMLPVIITLEAPKALAANKLTIPIGPAPNTRTTAPKETFALLQACTPTDRGSRRAPSSNET